MGILWFNAFVFLGLLMRKLKFPIIFSVVPLALLLILSVLRMFIMVELPGAAIFGSEILYPAIVDVFRLEIALSVRIVHVFVFAWVAGTVFLTAKYAYRYIGRFPNLIQWYATMPRDARAESLLAEIIGNAKHFRVYRIASFTTPAATSFKPYIILPTVEFTDNELRIILLHEWQHIQDRDYLADIIVNLVCFVFWWNPIVYILKKNFQFAMELKCDGHAVSNNQDFQHLFEGLVKLDYAEKEKEKARSLNWGNALVSKESELIDRLTVLSMRWEESRRKWRWITNIGCSVTVVLLFFASYTFTVLPHYTRSPYASVTSDDFMGKYSEAGDVFNMSETELLLVDNGNGTFSYYVGGNFIMYVDANSELLGWIEIHER
jgi:beta-lactamase regulating signal transducer with metallopeptidase domain